jgi:hypothetical protein
MILSALMALALQTAATKPPAIKLQPVRARLFYKETGRLSDDILPMRDGAWHNTIIGEGSAEEYADDLLVTVEIKSEGYGDDAHTNASALEITATNRSGKVLGRRKFDSVLTSERYGRATSAMWLNDVTCAGEITIMARYERQVQSAKVVMRCGE